MYFLLNEWMDVLCLVPSRNTIKVSGEKATSKRKTNSIKGNAHKSFKCVVKYTVALNCSSFCTLKTLSAICIGSKVDGLTFCCWLISLHKVEQRQNDEL